MKHQALVSSKRHPVLTHYWAVVVHEERALQTTKNPRKNEGISGSVLMESTLQYARELAKDSSVDVDFEDLQHQLRGWTHSAEDLDRPPQTDKSPSSPIESYRHLGANGDCFRPRSVTSYRASRRPHSLQSRRSSSASCSPNQPWRVGSSSVIAQLLQASCMY